MHQLNECLELILSMIGKKEEEEEAKGDDDQALSLIFSLIIIILSTRKKIINAHTRDMCVYECLSNRNITHRRTIDSTFLVVEIDN